MPLLSSTARKKLKVLTESVRTDKDINALRFAHELERIFGIPELACAWTRGEILALELRLKGLEKFRVTLNQKMQMLQKQRERWSRLNEALKT